MPIPGDSFTVAVTLEGGETDLYVKAILKDSDNLELPFSPLAVPHRHNGLYLTRKIYPDTDFVSIVYEIYKDAAFTEPALYFIEGQVLDKSIESEIIDQINDHTTDQVNKLAYTGQVMSVEASDDSLELQVEDSELRVEVVDEQTANASVEQDEELVATAEDNKLDVEVADDGDIDVEAKC